MNLEQQTDQPNFLRDIIQLSAGSPVSIICYGTMDILFKNEIQKVGPASHQWPQLSSKVKDFIEQDSANLINPTRLQDKANEYIGEAELCLHKLVSEPQLQPAIKIVDKQDYENFLFSDSSPEVIIENAKQYLLVPEDNVIRKLDLEIALNVLPDQIKEAFFNYSFYYELSRRYNFIARIWEAYKIPRKNWIDSRWQPLVESRRDPNRLGKEIGLMINLLPENEKKKILNDLLYAKHGQKVFNGYISLEKWKEHLSASGNRQEDLEWFNRLEAIRSSMIDATQVEDNEEEIRINGFLSKGHLYNHEYLDLLRNRVLEVRKDEEEFQSILTEVPQTAQTGDMWQESIKKISPELHRRYNDSMKSMSEMEIIAYKQIVEALRRGFYNRHNLNNLIGSLKFFEGNYRSNPLLSAFVTRTTRDISLIYILNEWIKDMTPIITDFSSKYGKYIDDLLVEIANNYTVFDDPSISEEIAGIQNAEWLDDNIGLQLNDNLMNIVDNEGKSLKRLKVNNALRIAWLHLQGKIDANNSELWDTLSVLIKSDYDAYRKVVNEYLQDVKPNQSILKK